MIIRDAAEADFSAIRRVLIEAFGQPAEADLVEALRADGSAAIDLVAEADGGIVGHVLVSCLQAPENCLALAPVCVAPRHQNQGIGSALIRAALERARANGWQAVFVLGEPGYYGRFGFKVETAARFQTDYPKAYFMALELAPGVLESREGAVIYASSFLDLD